MSGTLLRLPDQFRPSRDTARAATPTCCSCCCCCCCAATLISSSVVLPMQVELMKREAPPALRNALGLPGPTAKWLAGLAPVTSVAAGILAGVATESFVVFLGVVPLVFLTFVATAYADVGRAGRSVAAVIVFSVCFAVEVVAGAFLVLATAGIGYAILAVFVTVVVVNRQSAKLKRDEPEPW